MGIAEDLLQQANHLLSYEGENPSQASLRRAVSTAYYALFHLLVEDGGKRWQGSAEAQIAVQRAYDHGQMKNVSNAFFGSDSGSSWARSSPVPLSLRRVARTFNDLQEQRHAADYDNNISWSSGDVRTLIERASLAFQDWYAVRNEPIAGNYLLAMLLKKR